MFVAFDGFQIYLAVIFGFGILSFFMFRWTARLDSRNYILQKATPSTIELSNPFDDVWLRGHITSKEYVSPPHFSQKCVYYHYRKKERRERTVRDKDGNTKKEVTWVTVADSKNYCNFILNDGSGEIIVDPKIATIEYIEDDYDSEFSYRYYLDFIPHRCEISAAGVIDENKVDITKKANVPLFLTLLDRKSFFKKTERKEFYMRLASFFFLFVATQALLLATYHAYIHPGWGYLLKDYTNDQITAFSVLLNFSILTLFAGIHIFNRLITLKKRCNNAFAQIDVDLKQRYDLIPNLVEIVKTYQEYEKDLFKSVVTARNSKDLNQVVNDENKNTKEVSKLLALAESYPELKTEPMEVLLKQLKNIEDKIAFGRQVCNETITEYNTYIESFPFSIIANLFKIKRVSKFASEK